MTGGCTISTVSYMSVTWTPARTKQDSDTNSESNVTDILVTLDNTLRVMLSLLNKAACKISVYT